MTIVNRIGTIYPCGSNKELSLRFCVGFQVWHKTPEEGQSSYRLKHYVYSNKDDVNSPNILTNNNYQASTQRFRQINKI